jgi:hypothetical protein
MSPADIVTRAKPDSYCFGVVMGYRAAVASTFRINPAKE